MACIGIVAEFDPFHRGHAHLLARARQIVPEAPVVVALSGHYTQRGGTAALSPWARAEMALRCGADLVAELPLPWAISSAEGFAWGGVSVLAALGADTLVFGSESGDAAALALVAECLRREDCQALLRQELAGGIPYAAARQRAAAALLGENAASVLTGPNDLLGVAYLDAIGRLGAEMTAVAVPRVGPKHDSQESREGYTSASALRRLLLAGELEQTLDALPEPARPVLRREWEAGLAPASLERCQRAVLYRLRMMGPEDFAALPDCSEGLEHRLYRAAQRATSLEEFYALAKTKRYAHARIRRLALWAFLGMTAADRPERLPYVRVLGMNARGREVLHTAKKTCPVPILTKPAAARRLDETGQRLFALEQRGADLWRLCLPGLEHSAAGSGWTTGPVLL
ncbi:MAG: nucleotidyltransferase family protein [Clostridiales bacterium]|nr:nucleotidyltransferase family protein [Clostridiales bacterium]